MKRAAILILFCYFCYQQTALFGNVNQKVKMFAIIKIIDVFM